MRIDLPRLISPEEAKEWVRRDVDPHPVTKLPYGSTIHDADTGEPVVALTRYPGDLEAYRAALLRSPWNNNKRNSGIANVAAPLGFTCRKPLWRQYACGVCAFARSDPETHSLIEDGAGHAYDEMKRILPEQASATAEIASVVHPDWRMVGTPWTSGVINLSSALLYHFDKNNFRGAWSAMTVVRRGARGGNLHLPEYDVTIACRDGDLLFFPASGLLHGVTPIDLQPDGYRITTVYYSIRNMKSCLPVAEEHARAQTYLTGQAEGLLERQRAEGLLK